MKISLLLICSLASACAQLTITASGKKNTVTTTVNVLAVPAITTLSCLPKDVFEGDPLNCAITLDRGAPAGGFVIGVSTPGIPRFNVTVPAGVTSAAFTLTVPPLPVTVAQEPPEWLNPRGYVAGIAHHKPLLVLLPYWSGR